MPATTATAAAATRSGRRQVECATAARVRNAPGARLLANVIDAVLVGDDDALLQYREGKRVRAPARAGRGGHRRACWQKEGRKKSVPIKATRAIGQQRQERRRAGGALVAMPEGRAGALELDFRLRYRELVEHAARFKDPDGMVEPELRRFPAKRLLRQPLAVDLDELLLDVCHGALPLLAVRRLLHLADGVCERRDEDLRTPRGTTRDGRACGSVRAERDGAGRDGTGSLHIAYESPHTSRWIYEPFHTSRRMHFVAYEPYDGTRLGESAHLAGAIVSERGRATAHVGRHRIALNRELCLPPIVAFDRRVHFKLDIHSRRCVNVVTQDLNDAISSVDRELLSDRPIFLEVVVKRL